jgi:hypothetical protein
MWIEIKGCLVDTDEIYRITPVVGEPNSRHYTVYFKDGNFMKILDGDFARTKLVKGLVDEEVEWEHVSDSIGGRDDDEY